MKLPLFFAFAIALTCTIVGCTPRSEATSTTTKAEEKDEKIEFKKPSTELYKFQKAYFAAGCFWCEEAVFESIKGVEAVISGYSGGTKDDPTYEEVGTGSTGHAEAVKVYYDSTKVSFEDLLRVYFASEDPTQVNGQGPDHGTQYRSIIFYQNDREKKLAESKIAALNASGKYSDEIAVQVAPFTKWWDAEEYHQDYVPQHPENPYVQHESIPRLKRTKAEVQDLLK
jgi:peptide-methionine (S)-S-oxide reductase